MLLTEKSSQDETSLRVQLIIGQSEEKGLFGRGQCKIRSWVFEIQGIQGIQLTALTAGWAVKG